MSLPGSLYLGEVSFGYFRLKNPLPPHPRPLDKFKKDYYARRNMEPPIADIRQPDEPEWDLGSTLMNS